MSVKWTEEQQKVIDLRNRNILVSAAAGSGKTAVLVERIIQMLTDRENPVDVDRLLIVTFTEAAAAEMKDRIRDAIEKTLEQEPDNINLQRQATLIHSAPITTIHSFCLSVIRDHFHVIDIDPGFRIAEEGELKLLKQDVIEELLEACYANGAEKFLEMAEKLGGGRSDKKLEEEILKLYEYSRSYPQPKRWLEQCVEQYKNDGKEPEFILQAMNRIRQYMVDILEVLREGIMICEEPDGPYMQAEILETDLKMLEKVMDCASFSEIYSCLSSLKWKRLSTKKDESVSPEKREQVKDLRNQVKKMVEDLSTSYFYETPEEIYKDLNGSYQTMHTFVELVNRFAEAFAEKKQSKNLIDFGDMEQFALQILTEEVDGELRPSATAKEYQEQFAEVMIDEYQDSNLIQEAILTSVSTVESGKYNIFMVGDVKQSIYRFRLSRPELFMEKYDTYSLEDSVCQRIDLHKNFRSRTEVLDGANYIFRRVMRKELGGISYDDQAALYPGATFEPVIRPDGTSELKTEILVVDTEESHTKEVEARVVAQRIRELIRDGVVTDKTTGKLRKVQYRDIVILTRSITGWADVYATILAEEGIPAYSGSQEGYFGTYEVSVLLDYLRILDNKRQDLPLTAVLTSPFVGLRAEQLAEIRTASIKAHEKGTTETSSQPDLYFYEAVERAAKEHKGEIGDKLRRFYAQTEHFREMLPYTPIHELLWRILEETGYGLYISAMPGGEQRAANVEMLIEKAAVFEGTSYKGLFHFVRYIEQLQKYDIDYGEANIVDEQADTIRIMSIHKSKGLEFPIVFVVGMGKRFNMTDITGSILIHPEWGVGMDAIDLERRTKIPTLLKKVIQQEVKMETLGEELRVLYVALTRAKEKLIMVGTADQKKIDRIRNIPIFERDAVPLSENRVDQGQIEPLLFHQLVKARSYMDWVLDAVLGNPTPICVSVITQEDLEVEEYVKTKGDAIARDVLEHWNTKVVYDEALQKHLDEQGRFVYPYQDEQKMQMKFTVSELKKYAYLKEESGEEMYEEPEIVPLIPKFMQETEELKGASRGSAYHKVLELLDFRMKYEEETLGAQIQKFREEGRLSKEMADCIRIPDILLFLNSEAGKRMQRAAENQCLWKEQPFVLGVPATEIYPEIQSDEMILVQGIIDVCFEEDGELVVLDYKTDRVRKAEELREKYHAQLDYYAEALEQLLQKPVKEKIIYSFTLRETLKC